MDWFAMFILACGAILVMVGVADVRHRIFIADCVGRGGFVIGVIGIGIKFLSVPLQNIIRLPESLTLWMCVILILISTVIMMLTEIHEVLLEIRYK